MRNNFTKAVLFGMAVITVIVLLLPGCKSKTEQKKEPPALKVLDIKGNTLPVYVQMVGQAVGIPTVNITARVEGYLQNWSFSEGSVVSKGSLLFRIEQDKYINDVSNCSADLESQTAAWEKAKLDVARLKPLLSTNAISQNDYDVAVTTERQTKAAVESAKAKLADANLNLSYTSITSPITGMIGKVNVNPGNLVGHGEATLLTTVSAVDPMYIDFQMNEADYLKIMRYLVEYKLQLKDVEKTFKVYLTLSDKGLYPFPGKIDFIDRAINPTTGTLAMRAEVPNADGLLKPGNFTTVNLILMEREGQILIPQSSTTQIQGKFFAFLLGSDNKVSRIPIVIGRSIGNKVVIAAGLKPGDKILLEGFQRFQEGMQIKPVIVADTAKLIEEFK
jgi:membrane fusion protein (multidrug efflux system)